MIYALVLLVHSWLRWVVLALGLALLTGSLRVGRANPNAWPEGLERLRRGFLASLDTQMLLGLLLYLWLSPLGLAGPGDLGAAMGEPVRRFYAIEHIVGMIAGVAVAHIGARMAMRAEGTARLRALVLTQILWLLITLGSIPWPGLPYGRPLLRMP